MLSNDLRGLKLWFDGCVDGLWELTPEGARAFSDDLTIAIKNAEALERASTEPANPSISLIERLHRLHELQQEVLDADEGVVARAISSVGGDPAVVVPFRRRLSAPVFERDPGGAA